MDIFEKLKSISQSSAQPAGSPEFIIAGLGNPGTKYQDTRHNAGFMAVDTLAAKYNTDIKKIRFKSLCTNIIISGKNCLVMKPSTYMNNSGEAVTEAMRFYKIPPENVIIIYDDISLAPSKLRIRRKGSDGGHNGIKNIIYLSGSDEFPRIKLGVGKKPHPDYNLADWVLSNFRSEEIPLMKQSCENACHCIELMIDGKTDMAMNKYNS